MHLRISLPDRLDTRRPGGADAKLAGQQQRDKIIADARAEAQSIINEAKTQAATANAATDAKDQELTKLEAHIAE